jgi:phosphatidylserine/phosphatidylglycerophosphate/cardiolipin synthase-like enzyme
VDERERWFLTTAERGNPDTTIDSRRDDGRAYTEGNEATPLIDGATYFKRLYEVVTSLAANEWVHFTDWRGDPDERLAGPRTEIANILRGAAGRGVHVRGLVWRSHPDQARFSEQENLHLVETVDSAGGEVLLDERVRKGGSHHQKLFLIRHPSNEDRDVAFAGGIDLCYSRNDDGDHLGDEQTYEMNRAYGGRPPWHDAQLQVRGPAIGDLAVTFRERWEDDTPLDRRNPLRFAMMQRAHQPSRRPEPLPGMPVDPSAAGRDAIQVLRTYPYVRRNPYPFARRGERSIARAYAKAVARAEKLIYVEDQYFWSVDMARLLADALSRKPELRLIAVVPKYPEQGGLSSHPESAGQHDALEVLRAAGGDRVAIYDLENERGTPIYVHAKVCVIDDTWAMVGSDNLNRRSWSHDSELSCVVLGDERDHREPLDPGGKGDGARVFARELRLRLWREHLRDAFDETAGLDSASGFDLWRDAAAAGRGRCRPHTTPPVPAIHRVWSRWMYRYVVDPDGRPRELRRRGQF